MFLPIEEYGLIGNMHTAALVGVNGSIDWLCLDAFDTPSTFAAVLDTEKGGHFVITPHTEEATPKQFYWPETNILVTRFLCEGGVAEVVDYMPVGLAMAHMRERWLIRQVHMVRGSLPLTITCKPAFDYARATHTTEISEHGAVFHSEGARFGLSSPLPLEVQGDAATTEFVLNEGKTLVFSLQLFDEDGPADLLPPLTPEEEGEIFDETVAYWQRWLEGSTYTGRWRETVHRSALAMKLLTYEPTGAIVAAPTTSLPESIGGERNWDYRYTWLRDAAFTVYGFIRIGFTEEARDFMYWLEDRLRELNNGGTLQPLYSIHGEHNIPEEELPHLSGYENSTPVRIGNAAHEQRQLDIYGALLDAIYLYNKYSEPVSYEMWTYVRHMLNWVCENWQQKDQGIWEVRGPARAFVYSRVMLWVALDRGIRLSDKRSLPAPQARWREVRDTIYEEIMDKGWNEEIEAFTQYYGGESLDAANLIMPLVFFMSPHDPRMNKTIDAIMRPPAEGGLTSDGLVFRYNPTMELDGLEGEEGTFNMCTFWLVEALTRAGRLHEARYLFEKMLTYANHLGLYAEETGFRGQALGNFPQAFTHLALISAAYNLDRALG